MNDVTGYINCLLAIELIIFRGLSIFRLPHGSKINTYTLT